MSGREEVVAPFQGLIICSDCFPGADMLWPLRGESLGGNRASESPWAIHARGSPESFPNLGDSAQSGQHNTVQSTIPITSSPAAVSGGEVAEFS
jgi:hypothetical protein